VSFTALNKTKNCLESHIFYKKMFYRSNFSIHATNIAAFFKTLHEF